MPQKKRALFVFAGQSNMMGAPVYAPDAQITYADSYEYLHKPVRMGEKQGIFKNTAYPAGEFSYCDMKKAYGESTDSRVASKLANYTDNTYFCPAMSNLLCEAEKTTLPFNTYSEADFTPGPCLPPYLVHAWESRGHCCAYAHIAKGAVSIEHFLNPEMLARFDRECAALPACERPVRKPMVGASGLYFEEKVRDFFRDSAIRFPEDDLSDRALVWLQGETDAGRTEAEYRLALDLLWEQAQRLGFTHFFCVRVGWWNRESIIQVLRAQEDFCRETENAYMLTRAASYMPLPGMDMSSWFSEIPPQEFGNCRDSFFGFANNHFNQKGFETMALHSIDNLERVLVKHLPPVLEPERIRGLQE